MQGVSQSGRDNTMMSTYSDYSDGDDYNGNDDDRDDVGDEPMTMISQG